jgi:hypothetical protein
LVVEAKNTSNITLITDAVNLFQNTTYLKLSINY